MLTSHKPRTQAQNSTFHKLLTLRRFDAEDKAELVKLMTNGRSSSSKDMYFDEMQLAIKRLQDEQDGSLRKMRAKIINIARDIFSMAPGDAWTQMHYDKLNVFLKKNFKEELSKLDYKTLINAVTAMERWRASEMKKVVDTLLNGI